MVGSNRVRWILSSKLVGFPLEKFALKSPISFEPPFQGLCWICAPQIFLNVRKSVWSTYTLWFSISAKDQEISEWKYEVMALPIIWTKEFEKFCPKLQGRIFQKFDTSYFHSEISWPKNRYEFYFAKISLLKISILD